MNVKKISLIIICLLPLVSDQVNAQVSITLGAQGVYDDNIFLENTKPRPTPLVLNDQLIDEINSERLSTQFPANFDGKTNSDFITNLFLGAEGSFQSLGPAIRSNYDLEVGTLLFAEFTEQSRITVDGNLELSLSDLVLPQPYYATLRNSVVSNSNNVAAASGTATQSVQNYIVSAETGIRRANITRDSFYSLGYIGSYQKFLGQFMLEDTSDSDTIINQPGVDFHSHMGRTSIDYQVNRDLEIGLAGSGGVQIFTELDNGDFGDPAFDPSDLDRTNAELQGTSKYILSQSLSFTGSGGLAFSRLDNAPMAREITYVDEDGETITETRELNDSDTGLTFALALNYSYRPGSIMSLGATQGFTTNLDGQRFTSRIAFLNLSEPLTEDLRLILGGSYMQFEDQSEFNPDFDRVEGSISLNYHLTQSTALVAGYNYTVQTSDDENIAVGSFASPEFKGNRFFLGINTGFVGLPL